RGADVEGFAGAVELAVAVDVEEEADAGAGGGGFAFGGRGAAEVAGGEFIGQEGLVGLAAEADLALAGVVAVVEHGGLERGAGGIGLVEAVGVDVESGGLAGDGGFKVG